MASPFDVSSLQHTVFIIGCARSGTTILQNALNSSPKIYLFGEADFYRHHSLDNAREHYNAMHRSFHNHITKSTFLPCFVEPDGPFDVHLRHLAKYYTLVGDKIALGPGRSFQTTNFLDFHSQHFFHSRNIFTFRAPDQNILSLKTMFTHVPIKDICITYLQAIELYLHMRRIFLNVTAVFHEDIARETFADLERHLGIELPVAHRYFDHQKVRVYSLAGIDSETALLIQRIEPLYAALRNCQDHTFDQIEQHAPPLNNPYPTRMGQLLNDVCALREELERERVEEGSPDSVRWKCAI